MAEKTKSNLLDLDPNHVRNDVRNLFDMRFAKKIVQKDRALEEEEMNMILHL